MTNPSEVLERGTQAWRARDPEAFASTYSEDAVMTGPGGMELHGRDGAKQFMAGWCEAVPDNDVEIVREHVCGSVVVQEGTFMGTHTGNLTAPDGQVVPPTGRSIRAPYVEVFELDGDHVVADRLYFDQVELLTQLGLMPAPAATG